MNDAAAMEAVSKLVARDIDLAKTSTGTAARIITEAYAEQTERVLLLEDFVKRLANAPDSQVSRFVRTACAGFLHTKEHKLPAGDPFARLTRQRAVLRQLVKTLRELNPCRCGREKDDMNQPVYICVRCTALAAAAELEKQDETS